MYFFCLLYFIERILISEKVEAIDTIGENYSNSYAIE